MWSAMSCFVDASESRWKSSMSTVPTPFIRGNSVIKSRSSCLRALRRSVLLIQAKIFQCGEHPSCLADAGRTFDDESSASGAETNNHSFIFLRADENVKVGIPEVLNTSSRSGLGIETPTVGAFNVTVRVFHAGAVVGVRARESWLSEEKQFCRFGCACASAAGRVKRPMRPFTKPVGNPPLRGFADRGRVRGDPSSRLSNRRHKTPTAFSCPQTTFISTIQINCLQTLPPLNLLTPLIY